MADRRTGVPFRTVAAGSSARFFHRFRAQAEIDQTQVWRVNTAGKARSLALEVAGQNAREVSLAQGSGAVGVEFAAAAGQLAVEPELLQTRGVDVEHVGQVGEIRHCETGLEFDLVELVEIAEQALERERQQMRFPYLGLEMIEAHRAVIIR